VNARGTAPSRDGEEDLFPPAFLRVLAAVPAAVKRLRAGPAEGRRAALGEGGRFLFRGHRTYRPGDDLRRVDWKVAARLGRLLVRQFDAERDRPTEVWIDGSGSMAPLGGRVKGARVGALAVAIGLASAGTVRLGRLREGAAELRLEAAGSHRLPAFLDAIAADPPQGRAGLARALPALVRRVPRSARLLLVSDLLSRAEPGVLHALAGRGLRGAVLHLRVPEVESPSPVGRVVLRDAETGATKTLVLDGAAAARATTRAREHAARWARHAAEVGLRYVPFAPTTADETLLRRLVETVP